MSHQVTELKLLQKSKTVSVHFIDGSQYTLPCEYLRVFSPSAEVRGQQGREGKLETGKKNVNIIGIDPVGQYAVKFIFDDGHDTGIYDWNTLYDLSIHYEHNWQRYLQRLAEAGANRET